MILFGGFMENALAIVGGLVIVSGIANFFLDKQSGSRSDRKRFSVDGLVRFLGIVGMVALFCVAFGIASWLISLVYWFVIELVAGSR